MADDISPSPILEVENDNVFDDAASDDTVIPEPYDITSYGADYDVEGIVRRIRRGEIFMPSFQREYVWNQTEASRFIESLLLGLPVPGVFLATDLITRKFLVIDGQQRLKTLLFFYNGFFNPREHEKLHRVFQLHGVQHQFEGKTYETLNETDRIRLDNSIIHATIVKQESPSDDETSIFHIFERLNNGGRRLTDQEIRVALYHGSLIEKVKDLNKYQHWRDLFGPPSNRLKDQEFILRFFALWLRGSSYTKPMKEFLNRFVAKHRSADPALLQKWEKLFYDTVDVAWQAFGKSAFRPSGALNAAVFDSVMVALAQRLEESPIQIVDQIQPAYERLLSDPKYIEATSRATSDEQSVERRLLKARKVFAEV